MIPKWIPGGLVSVWVAGWEKVCEGEKATVAALLRASNWLFDLPYVHDCAIGFVGGAGEAWITGGLALEAGGLGCAESVGLRLSPGLFGEPVTSELETAALAQSLFKIYGDGVPRITRLAFGVGSR